MELTPNPKDDELCLMNDTAVERENGSNYYQLICLHISSELATNILQNANAAIITHIHV